MAKLKSKIGYILALATPFFSGSVVAQDEEPKSKEYFLDYYDFLD